MHRDEGSLWGLHAWSGNITYPEEWQDLFEHSALLPPIPKGWIATQGPHVKDVYQALGWPKAGLT